MLTVQTLDGVAVTVNMGRRGSEDVVEFHDLSGRAVASIPAAAVSGVRRLCALVPGDPAWVIGPVELARVKALAAPYLAAG